MASEEAQGKEMTFWDHLDELRGTLFRSVLAVCIVACAGLAFKDLLFKVVLWPAESDFCVYRLLGWQFSMELINVDISAQFFVHLKASLAAGLVVAFPYVIWEVWKFVAPALYDNEKKAVKGAFLMSSGLFYIGVAVGYFCVLPVCLRFFMSYSVSPDIENTITIGSYMSMFVSMVLLVGIVFEFPTVIAALSRLGLVQRKTLRSGRKYAVVVILVISALITPSDPFSMLVLSVPLYLLYELSILMCAKDAPETEEDDID